MTETGQPETVPPTSNPSPAAPKNVFQRFAGVLFAPAETFEDIVRKPNVLAPMIILILIAYVSTFVIMPIMDWDAVLSTQETAMRAQNPNLSDADVERMAGFTKTIGKVMGFIGPIFGVIWWLVVAAVLFLTFRMFGGQGTFGAAFSLTVYSWIPLTLFSIVLTIVARAKGAFDPTHAATIVMSNPAFLVDLKAHPVLFALLGSFDVFTIWTIVLLIIGFATMARFSKAKSTLMVLPLWILMILIRIGFVALGAMRAKG